MSNQYARQAFAQFEDEQLRQNKFVKNGLSTALSGSTMITAVSKGAALGAAIGAPFAGIGAIPGTAIGSIVSGGLALLGTGALSYYVLPELSFGLMKTWRYLKEGSREQRFEKHLAKLRQEAELKRLTHIAFQIKEMQNAGVRNEPQQLTAGLSVSQQQMFARIYQLTDHLDPSMPAHPQLKVDPKLKTLSKQREQEILANQKRGENKPSENIQQLKIDNHLIKNLLQHDEMKISEFVTKKIAQHEDQQYQPAAKALTPRPQIQLVNQEDKRSYTNYSNFFQRKPTVHAQVMKPQAGHELSAEEKLQFQSTMRVGA